MPHAPLTSRPLFVCHCTLVPSFLCSYIFVVVRSFIRSIFVTRLFVNNFLRRSLACHRQSLLFMLDIVRPFYVSISIATYANVAAYFNRSVSAYTCVCPALSPPCPMDWPHVAHSLALCMVVRSLAVRSLYTLPHRSLTRWFRLFTRSLV